MAKMMMMQQSQPSLSLLTSSVSDFNGAKLHLQVQYKRKVQQPKGALYVSASSEKKILIMGGTRFIGIFLSRLLVKEGHQVTLFTRGKSPIAKQLPGESDQDFADFSSKILHLKGDRKDYDFVKSSLSAEGFDVVYDINGREAEEVEPILDALPKLEQYIYCSSAGVYLKSDVLPHCEVDAVDPKSRHKGKLETESLLQSKGVNWTSIRPVYIYGPLNYNPVEEWFFHRLKAGRPIPVPNSGIQISQLGHVKDLATAFLAVLGNEKASREIFNISGEKYVTFDGLARACAKAGGFPEPEIVHYNLKSSTLGRRRLSLSVTSISLPRWRKQSMFLDGNLDFGRGTFRKEADFTTDDMILSKKLVLL
ncbi:chloroplast stem-loop binding protein of 41 kDa b, chloroplastic isoform X2 [Brassica napus]|uniref:chloroplast stem-loop binding protein of 41 kDa b, chloroplastic isoform X2 n=1 Tax=Brassica napus TaxID=3708 RepID=UPI00207868B9|nr:chloroplast stem-loop binding protein of 41 kDa b, chloroplastic isoform X2 [Brassica napus]